MNLTIHELHNIALLCANPDTPNRDSLARLRPPVRVLAISILNKLSPDTYKSYVSYNAAHPAEAHQEIDQATNDFIGYLMGQKGERDLCTLLESST